MSRVLVVDDEPAVCRVVAETLSDMGIEADEATGGEEALVKLCEATVQGREYDAVVVDIVMPFTDGWQVLRAIKNNPLWKDMAVIVLTGQATSAEDVRRVSDYEGVFIEKKGSFPHLVQRIVSRLVAANPADEQRRSR